MNDLRGYSYTIVKAIKAADQTLPGVRLAQVCIAHDIPVTAIANKLIVSRQTVYNWFIGRFKPKQVMANRIETLILQYRKVKV